MRIGRFGRTSKKGLKKFGRKGKTVVSLQSDPLREEAGHERLA
jgi:hypothetical protein